MSDVCVWLNVMLCLCSISKPASLVMQCLNSRNVCAEDHTKFTNCLLQDMCNAVKN